MKNIFIKLPSVLFFIAINYAVQAQENTAGYKTSVDMTVDNVGSVICEYNTKYNAAYWDNFTKTIGTNTSILMNNLIKLFPKYHLSEFNYSQDANERSNKVKFKIDGMMNINKNGKWEADLEKKNPDITKLSDKEFLLIEEGATLKIHLPPGTDDAKVEKNSFGKALLTYSPNTSSGMGNIFRYSGILIALAGAWLLFKNRKGAKTKPVLNTVYEQITPHKEINEPTANKEIGS